MVRVPPGNATARTGAPEQGEGAGSVRRVVPGSGTDALPARDVQGRRPLLWQGVVGSAAQLGCDAELASAGRVEIRDPEFGTDSPSDQQPPSLDVTPVDHARVTKGFEPGATAMIREVATAMRRPKVETQAARGTTSREPPRLARGTRARVERLVNAEQLTVTDEGAHREPIQPILWSR